MKTANTTAPTRAATRRGFTAPRAGSEAAGAPLHLGEGRYVVGVQEFLLLLAVVPDLQEPPPGELADALRVAGEAGDGAHDVLA